LYGLRLVRSFETAPPQVFNVDWSADGTMLAATAINGWVAVWQETSKGPYPYEINSNNISSSVIALAWHPVCNALVTVSQGGLVRLWEASTRESQWLSEVGAGVRGAALSPDGRLFAVTDQRGGLSVWDAKTGEVLRRVRAHRAAANRPCWSPDGQVLLTASDDGNVGMWARDDLRLLRRLKTYENVSSLWDIAVSPDGATIASAAAVAMVGVWDLPSGAHSFVLEGHTSAVVCVRFSPDGEFLASLAEKEAILWRCRDWERLTTIPRADARGVGGLAFHPSLPLLAVKDNGTGKIDCFQIDDALRSVGGRPESRRYVNAKVVLIGDTGVGKSGLGLVLSGQPYRPTESTHGRNVWTFDSKEVEIPGQGRQTREVMLWDLAGQPGYRMVHQLHLGEVAVALVVFDSRSEIDPFSGVKHWVRALAQARRLEGGGAVPLRAYLVAARADCGGVAVSRKRVEAMIADLGLDGFFETSAKEGWQIADLAEAVRAGIDWDSLPMVSSNAMFSSIKAFLIEEKQQGRVLSTADDLFRGFRRTQPFTLHDIDPRWSFEACIGRVESRGLIRRLHFGDLVLLQPELLDSYASALVLAAKDEPDGLGFIAEEEALEGRFRMAEDERIRDRAQEKLLLIATVEELLRHEIALKETTDRGIDLIFPSQFTRERPDAPNIAGKRVIFALEGPLQSIYATLAVRLSHSTLFQRKAMWQNAASYTATGGGTCGIHLREIEEGHGEVSVFYDEQAGEAVRLQFETYVFEHLQQRALPGTVVRRRVRDCPACGYVLPDDLVQGRLALSATTIRCPLCEKTIIGLAGEERPALAEAAVAEMNRSADERRDLNVATTRLKGKIETGDYDVFLCYNASDKSAVVAIAERLKERGILPWLDVWELQPGMRWQPELRRRIKTMRSAALFLGPRGPGPWQQLEVEAMLDQIGKRSRPIIPVVLEGRRGRPRLPGFLNLLHMVDMRVPDPDPFEQLIWGITGERADLPLDARPATAMTELEAAMWELQLADRDHDDAGHDRRARGEAPGQVGLAE
jgi:WD40 repeat protein